jgi:hypothetical protein
MALTDGLQEIAEELRGESWRTKRKSDWTPEDRQAYERWTRAEWDTVRRGDAQGVEFIVSAHDDPANDLPPHHLTFTIAIDRVTGDGNDAA